MSPVLKSTLIGAALGIIGSILLITFSETKTWAKDWPLVVMLIWSNTFAFFAGARYKANMLGIALSGLLGFVILGWIGNKVIGDYEYKVPVPKEARELVILTGGQNKVIELKDMPEEEVKRFKIGFYISGTLGFTLGAMLFGRFMARREPVELASDEGG